MTQVADNEVLDFPITGGGDLPERSVEKNVSDLKKTLDAAVEPDNPRVHEEALVLALKYPGEKTIDQICSIYGYMKNGDQSKNGWGYVSDPRGLDYFNYANMSLKVGDRAGCVGGGDCDDFAILMSALVESVGGTTRIVLARNSTTGGHAYTEVYLGQINAAGSQVETIIDWLKGKFNTDKIYTHIDTDTKDVWLNLDWGADEKGNAHPGGPFFRGDKHIVLCIRDKFVKTPLKLPEMPEEGTKHTIIQPKVANVIVNETANISQNDRSNQPPVLLDLTGPDVIDLNMNCSSWEALGKDADEDKLYYRFILTDGKEQWDLSNGWTEENVLYPYATRLPDPWSVGRYELIVWVRDGKHAGPDSFDNRKEISFEVQNSQNEIESVKIAPVPVPEGNGGRWQRTFGGSNRDYASSVQQTSDDGYIIAGCNNGSYNTHFGDTWLIKTDYVGNEVWNKMFSGPYYEGASSVQQTSDGGYIIAADSGGANSDFWLIKVDSAGNKLWDRTFGGPYQDYPSSVQQTSDGGYLIAGEKDYDNTNYAWLVKTDPSGNRQWDRTLGKSHSSASSIQLTSDGGCIITGEALLDVLLIKIDSSGSEQWNTTFDGDGSDWDYASEVQTTSDGGYIIAGMTKGSFGDGARTCCAWLIKTDASGVSEWDKIFGSGSGHDIASSVQQTSDGGYIVAGSTGSYDPGDMDAWMIKTDSLGNEQWERTFGGPNDDFASSVQQTTDGGYIIAGSTESYGSGQSDAWLIKTDANGQLQG